MNYLFFIGTLFWAIYFLWLLVSGERMGKIDIFSAMVTFLLVALYHLRDLILSVH